MPRVAIVMAAATFLLATGCTYEGRDQAADGPLRSYVIRPEADVWVRVDEPSARATDDDRLRVRDGEEAATTFLRFDLPAGPGQWRLRLRMWAERDSASGGAVHVVDGAWSPEEVTWSGSPEVQGPPLAEVGPVADNSWAEVDLGTMPAQDEISLALVGQSDRLVEYSSSEGKHEPQLIAVPATDASPPGPVPEPRGQGLWISHDELMALPMHGPAWERMWDVATGDLGQADLADQDSNHDIATLALAYVAARTGDEQLLERATQEILSVIGTDENEDEDCHYEPDIARSLAVGRNLVSYIVAADVIGLDPDGEAGSAGRRFAEWVDQVRHKPNCPHTGEGEYPDGDWFDLSQFHDWSASNVSSMAGASRIAAALYLGDTAEVERAWATYRRYLGDTAVGPELMFNDNGLTWTPDPDDPRGVNPPGATIAGHSVDGAIPNDIGRGGEFDWPPGHTQYPWEGIAGMYVQAELLSRAGYPSWEVQDRAPLRAVLFLRRLADEFGDEWWDHTDWAKYVANHVYGESLPISGLADEGKNMAWTDWTHGDGRRGASGAEG